MTERQLAEAARVDFCHTKRALLRDVARERRTQADVVKKLRRRFAIAQSKFLKAEGTTYATWLEHGPKAELDELLEAARDPAVWDRLVETYEARKP